MDEIERQLRDAQDELSKKSQNQRPQPPDEPGLIFTMLTVIIKRAIGAGHKLLWLLSPLAGAVVLAIWVSNKLANEHVDHPENVFPIVMVALYRPAIWLHRSTNKAKPPL